LEQKTILFLLFGSLVEFNMTGKRAVESFVINGQPGVGKSYIQNQV